jgi:hypothetical protein
MRHEKQTSDFNCKLKNFLFVFFFVEGNSKWVAKFNKHIMKCHEKIETNFRTNYDLEDEEKEVSNEDLLVRIIEQIEVVHDFEGEI